MWFALAQIAPHEDHGCTRRGREQNEPGDIRIDLIGWKIGPEEMADEQPAKRRHREGFDRPIDKQGHADAAPVFFDLMKRGKIDLDEHRDDHQPDENRNRQVHLRDFGGADQVKDTGEKMTQDDTNDDTETDPKG